MYAVPSIQDLGTVAEQTLKISFVRACKDPSRPGDLQGQPGVAVPDANCG